MDAEFLENEDITSNEVDAIIYKYNNIVNKNSFYKDYSKTDENFKRLYQKEFSSFLRLGNSYHEEYTEEQIYAIRNLVSQITKNTSQNGDIVKIRKKQTVKVNEDIYLLFQTIDSMTYELEGKIHSLVN